MKAGNLYGNLYRSDEEINKALHLQVMARLKPHTITYPAGWVPRTQLDKFVAKNMIMDMSIGEIMKIFPKFSVNFVKKSKGI